MKIEHCNGKWKTDFKRWNNNFFIPELVLWWMLLCVSACAHKWVWKHTVFLNINNCFFILIYYNTSHPEFLLLSSSCYDSNYRKNWTWQHDNMTTWQHDNMTTWQSKSLKFRIAFLKGAMHRSWYFVGSLLCMWNLLFFHF